jgi:peptidoglycan/xylan/chitin deacetylase (PgdA/CDA1 family)
LKYAERLSDDGAAIFLFHGVVERHECRLRNYTRKHIDVDYFASVLRELRGVGSPVSMDRILEAAEGRDQLPRKAFAITFDDGFANNLHVAAPVLSDMRIPATFYVTTNFIERGYMPWVDRIEWALERVERGTLRLPWGERTFTADADRIAMMEEMRKSIKSDPRADGDALADDVQRQLGFALTSVSPHSLDRKLTWREVAQLAASDDFIVAGHSHTHRILSYLSEDELEADIATSMRLLKERAGLESRHYAYPEGLSYCFSENVIAALKRHGVACCPSAEDGVNSMPADPFRLKRIFVV